ncbi:hypothetical protein [Streptomyces luteogriseus]|uniref:hypothetical protein n=1 Tax=Streptomyces luteogriseus TaxID=68233 RepID=UPI003790EEF0
MGPCTGSAARANSPAPASTSSWPCRPATSPFAFTAVLALAGGSRPDRLALLSTLVGLALLVPVWYRSAVTATDEWAAAVRALVDTGRKPLAASLGLALPQTLAAERDMWTMVSRLSRIPYHERAAALDRYRAEPATDPV